MPVRAEQTRDHDAVRAVHRTAFGADHGRTVAKLVDALRLADPQALSLVAEEDGEVVGHVMVSRALPSHEDTPPPITAVRMPATGGRRRSQWENLRAG